MMTRVGSSGGVADGTMHVFDVEGTKVSVASAGGHLYAFDDRCTHLGCSLGKGKLNGTIVTCPCHGSQFDATSGAVVHGPAQRPVRHRTVQVQGDELLVET